MNTILIKIAFLLGFLCALTKMVKYVIPGGEVAIGGKGGDVSGLSGGGVGISGKGGDVKTS